MIHVTEYLGGPFRVEPWLMAYDWKTGQYGNLPDRNGAREHLIARTQEKADDYRRRYQERV